MNKELNQRVRKIRHALDLSQQKFATKIGLKQGSLSDIERVRIGVSAAVMDAIIREFRVNVSWFHSGKGEIFIVDNYKIKGKNTGESTGDPLHDFLEHVGNDTLLYVSKFSEELSKKRPDLAELANLITNFAIYTADLDTLYKTYLQSHLVGLEDTSAKSYNEYKARRIKNLEAALKYKEALEPIVKALKQFIDSDFAHLDTKGILLFTPEDENW